MADDYFSIAVSVRLTHPAPLGKVRLKGERACTADNGFHLYLVCGIGSERFSC